MTLATLLLVIGLLLELFQLSGIRCHVLAGPRCAHPPSAPNSTAWTLG